MQLPSNVVHVPEGKSLASMMASGEIQAGFTADAGIGREGPPKPGWETHQRPSSAAYEELWKDGHTLGIEWYRRSREELCALIKAGQQVALSARTPIPPRLNRGIPAVMCLVRCGASDEAPTGHALRLQRRAFRPIDWRAGHESRIKYAPHFAACRRWRRFA